MKKFVVITDTCSDLDASLREEYGVEYLPMGYSLDGVGFEADLDWKHRSFKDFYDAMRAGKRFITAQVNTESFKNGFIKYIEEGYDVLYLSASSKLSSSIHASCVAREEVLKTHPNAKICCVDSLRSCHAEGLLAIRAAKMRDNGSTLEETVAWLEENKLTAHTEATVDKLTYLRQAGRVNAASAFFGGLLNIKPIIIGDAIGQNFAVEKVKTRKKSLLRLIERVEERYLENDYPVFVSHADSLEDAEYVRDILKEKLGADVRIGKVGPTIGATTGPGMIGVHFFGVKETCNAEK